MENGNQPAFPTDVWGETGFFKQGVDEGLTRREYAAIRFMQSLCSGPNWMVSSLDQDVELAVHIADRLFQVLNKSSNNSKT